MTVRGVPPRARRDGDARGVAKTRGWVAHTVAIGSVEADHVASFDFSKNSAPKRQQRHDRVRITAHGTRHTPHGTRRRNFFERETLPPPAIRS